MDRTVPTDFALPPAVAYAAYLSAGLAMLWLFTVIYTRVTHFDEWALIRQGNAAAALSLAGAMLGFSLTLALSIATHASWLAFAGWALVAMAVQLCVYVVMARVLAPMNQAIHEGNAAMGGAMGAISLSVGVINAACLT